MTPWGQVKPRDYDSYSAPKIINSTQGPPQQYPTHCTQQNCTECSTQWSVPRTPPMVGQFVREDSLPNQSVQPNSDHGEMEHPFAHQRPSLSKGPPLASIPEESFNKQYTNEGSQRQSPHTQVQQACPSTNSQNFEEEAKNANYELSLHDPGSRGFTDVQQIGNVERNPNSDMRLTGPVVNENINFYYSDSAQPYDM